MAPQWSCCRTGGAASVPRTGRPHHLSAVTTDAVVPSEAVGGCVEEPRALCLFDQKARKPARIPASPITSMVRRSAAFESRKSAIAGVNSVPAVRRRIPSSSAR